MCGEVSFELFTHCNLACSFCVQQNEERTKFDAALLPAMLSRFEHVLNAVSRKHYDIEIFGGELFQPSVPLSEIDAFLQQVNDLLKKHGKTANICITSNLQTKDIAAVVALSQKHKCFIFTSLDFHGRFTKERQIDLWMSNVDYLIDNHIFFRVSIIITRPNVQAIMCREPNRLLDAFNRLYEIDPNILAFEGYDTTNSNADKQYALSTEALVDFYKFLYYHYPKLYIVQSHLDILRGKSAGRVECTRVVPISRENYWDCTHGHFQQTMQKFIANKQCNLCKYFGRCGMMCFRRYADGTVCAKRQFLDYLSSRV